jgi:hypothetical protein
MAVLALTVAALVVGCNGTPSGSPSASARAAGGDAGSSSQPATGGSAAAGGDISSISACSLLTPAEIQQALGMPFKDGVLQTGDPEQASCEWASQDDSVSIGVIVQPYDDFLWQTMASSSLAKPVSGIGEAAFKDYPIAGDLSVKQGGREIDFGIADFTDSQQKIDAAALTMAKLVLSRL